MHDPDLLAAITLEELHLAQASDPFCKVIFSRLIGREDLPFAVDDRGFLSRYVEAFPQIVIPQTLKSRVLYIRHHAKLGAHPGGKKMYGTMRRFLCWLSMAVDAYAVSRNCVSCAKNMIYVRQDRNFLKLFPAKAPPEFVAIDILGELIRTPRGNYYKLLISDQFSKLVRTVPLKKVAASEVAKAFVHHWVFPYDASIWLLSDNGKQFIEKHFRETCRMLGVKNLYTTTYDPQINGQVERFNRTILASLRHYVADHPKDWDLFSDALTYAYKTQAHESTSVAPSELVLSRPPAPLALEATPSIDAVSDKAQYHKKWTTYAKALTSTARKAMEKRQLRHKRRFDDLVMPY